MKFHKLFYTVSEIGGGAFFIDMSMYIFFFVLLKTLFKIFFGKKFQNSWSYVLSLIMPFLFLFPIKYVPVWVPVKLPGLNFYIKTKSAEPIFTGIIDLKTLDGIENTETVISVLDILAVVWAAGFAVMFVYQFISLAVLRRRVKLNARPCENQEYLQLLEKICAEYKIRRPQLLIFPGTPTPFAMGMFRSGMILLSEDTSAENIEFILRHECIHIKRHDILIKFAVIVFRCMNWFNPFAYIMCRQTFEDMEITCDEIVVRDFSDERREEYSRTILKSAKKMHYPQVTTYLSSSAFLIKQRISAVMIRKKLSVLIPFFAVLSMCVTLMCITSAVFDIRLDENTKIFYPCPLERDEYNSTEGWRTVTADNSEEAGRKIFEQYMSLYMGEDIPDYYRINSYHITSTSAYDGMRLGGNNTVPGTSYPLSMITHGCNIFDSSSYCNIEFIADLAGKCGNTCHNIIYKSIGGTVDGIIIKSFISLEMEKHGNVYTLKNIGYINNYSSIVFNSSLDSSFNENNMVKYADNFAKAGLLDHDWDSRLEFPPADELNAAYFLQVRGNQKRSPSDLSVSNIWEIVPDDEIYAGVPSLSGRVYGFDGNIEYIRDCGCVDKDTGYIIPEKLEFYDRTFEYCGYIFDAETGRLTIHGNVCDGDKIHGVEIYSAVTEQGWFMEMYGVHVTEGYFEPVVYHDSFESIPLPDSLYSQTGTASAENILEYMKTPHNGADFTVLDYKNISEGPDGCYADVKFKGRLAGVHSGTLGFHEGYDPQGDEEYIRVKICGERGECYESGQQV